MVIKLIKQIKSPFIWIYRFYNYLQTWQEHRDTIKHLNRMTDKQLKDIGLTRGNINELVWLKEDKQARGNKK